MIRDDLSELKIKLVVLEDKDVKVALIWEVNEFRGKAFVFVDLIWKGRLRTFLN